MTVGKSHRTPFKHFVLNCTLGAWTGRIATGRVKFIWGDMHIADLCAGDGVPGEHGLSSPQIIHKHATWAASRLRSGVVRSTLIEIDRNTHSQLTENLSLTPANYRREVLLGDAREFRLAAGKNEAAFINADPNCVDNMPLAEELVATFPRMTTMTLTLGCNVGGIRRLGRDKRAKWYEYVEICTRRMQKCHDAILCSVVRDASKWAYLSIIPKVDTRTYMPKLFREGGKEFRHGVALASFREDGEQFERMIDELFLTNEELANATA